VTDTVGFMSPAAADRLESRLRTYEQQTGHQLLVWIGDTTGDDPIEHWADLAFNKWKVGRTKLDDGLVLFIMAKDRRLRIQVGYGLEGDVPDAIASRIINEAMVPRIRAGDNDGAVEAGMEAAAAATGTPLPGSTLAPVRRGREPQPLTLLQLIFYGIIGLIILIFLATHPSLALYLLANIFMGSGRRGGGGWDGGGFGGGGGGWSGGGGRSGGGGASGSW
jgi:uncharacterized protein